MPVAAVRAVPVAPFTLVNLVAGAAHIPAANGAPLVVAGDFNEWLPGSTVIRTFRARFDRPPALRTFPSWRPLLALDRIFAEPTTVLREVAPHCSTLSRIASDHLPLRASIRP